LEDFHGVWYFGSGVLGMEGSLGKVCVL
jgi:hypothetical protein